ncbi:MAG: TIGR01777 family protein [Saprospiraceae bacterium]|nr:TIGR01777 family protein [Saprospiraceae bacterium]
MSTILIAGGSGLVGNRLSVLLKAQGHKVLHLSRRANPGAAFPTYAWDPAKGTIDENVVAQADVVINLAGTGIAGARWTTARKQLIIDSRVQSAYTLLKAMKRTGRTSTYLSAAAVGYYGNSGDRPVEETTPPGKGFLAESCVEWEKAIHAVAAAGIRTAGFRIGIVLSSRGGALEKMLLSLRFGINTYFGNGSQWYSWIHLDDVCRLFMHAVDNPEMKGIYNAVAPNPVTNLQFAKALGKTWKGPSLLLPVPAIALRLVLGEMADVVLTGQRVSSKKASDTGFVFQFPDLEAALADVIKRKV